LRKTLEGFGYFSEVRTEKQHEADQSWSHSRLLKNREMTQQEEDIYS
jgi:hypothetical protein